MSSTLSTPETKINNRVASILARLANNLEPDALLRAINEPTMVSKGDLDNDTLGHAYYTLYYGLVKPRASVRPVSTSLLESYELDLAATAEKAAALNVVKQTDPAVYVASVCDAILPYTHMMIPAPLFCQVIRNVHPRELKNDYYHDPNICGSRFEPYLEMVNARLHEYFTDNRSLDDVLSGIKKCLCLRILSNNMYHYRDHPAGLDPAIQKLMRFYTSTDFLHASSQEVFDSHVHMIQKYKQLKELMEEFIKPIFKLFLRETKCAFGAILMVEPMNFIVVIHDVANGTPHELPRTLPVLQAFVESRNRPVPPRMSSSDMVHKVQSHFLNPRIAFDEGIRFVQLLTTRLDNGELTLDDITYNDLYTIYERTVDALLLLRKHGEQRDQDDDEFFKIMKKMDRYRRPMLTSGMVDLSKFAVAGPARSRSRSSSPSKKSRDRGGAKSKTRRSKSKTRRSKS